MLQLKPTTPPRHPQGFTLIELLMVIVVLAILASLLLPAISGAQKRARVSQVRVEISAIESAVASFRAEFGVEPPGSIRLYATSSGWTTTGATAAAEAIRVRSRAYIRQLWPQFDFTSTAGGAFWTTDKDLNGAECLAFFLGGVSDSGTATRPNGFSKNPSQPFSQTGTNRVAPFFDFVPSRLVDKDGDGFWEYVDPIPSQSSPYLYFDSNDGQGYTTYAVGTAPTGDWCNIDCFQDGYNNASSFGSQTWANGNWMKYCYYTVFQNTGTPTTDISASVQYMPKKFQIISPGFGGIAAATPDVAYGTGGLFNPKMPTTLTLTPDGDNITNFNPGTLSGE